jgi:hypothetical protein
MHMQTLSLRSLIAWLLTLALACGCATPTPLDAGVVVVAPARKTPPPPMVVQETPAKPVGYFQCLLLRYLGESCAKPTQ